MREINEAHRIGFFVPPMRDGKAHHVISRGQSPKFYRPEDLKDKGPGRTPWVIAFEEIIVGLHLALGGAVPFAFRTPDGRLRSLDAGCVKMILNRTPPELHLVLGAESYISAITPSRELLARYSGREDELRERVLKATGETSAATRLPLSPSAPPRRLPSRPLDHERIQIVDLPLTIERALIIREPWISLIVNGQKTWEMRPGPTSVRGWIGLAAQGTGQVVGLARLIESRLPLNARNYDQFVDYHAISPDQTAWAIENNWVFPWVLADVIRLPRPIPYEQRPGAVQFVNVDAPLGAELAQLAAHPSPSVAASAPLPVEPQQRERSTDGPVFIFTPERAKARAVLGEGGKGLRVLKGSTAMRSGSPAVKRDEAYRDELVRQGILRVSSDPELYEFTVDHEFDSASRAAGVVKDGNSSGPQQWRNPETGLTLKDYLDRGGRL